jgi:hypothetical protein
MPIDTNTEQGRGEDMYVDMRERERDKDKDKDKEAEATKTQASEALAQPTHTWRPRKYGVGYFIGVFSVLVFVIEMGMVGVILYWPSALSANNGNWVDMVMGTLLAHLTMVVQYWLGSSQGSKTKQEYVQEVVSKVVK